MISSLNPTQGLHLSERNRITLPYAYVLTHSALCLLADTGASCFLEALEWFHISWHMLLMSCIGIFLEYDSL